MSLHVDLTSTLEVINLPSMYVFFFFLSCFTVIAKFRQEHVQKLDLKSAAKDFYNCFVFCFFSHVALGLFQAQLYIVFSTFFNFVGVQVVYYNMFV